MRVYTRTKKQAGKATLYAKVKIGNVPTWLNTGLSVQISDWDKTFSLDADNKLIQSETKVNNLMHKLGYGRKLQEIENGLRDLREQQKLTVESANNLISIVVMADVRAKQDEQKERDQKAVDEQKKDVKIYIDSFIAGLTGDDVSSLTVKGKQQYAYNTVKIWNDFYREFCAFYATNRVGTWDELDERYISRFSQHLSKKFMKSTTARLILCFRGITERAFKGGVRTAFIPKDMFTRPEVKEQDKLAEIYLTRSELDALYRMELTGFREKVRDLFLVGCYTGQRFSDYSTIKKDNLGVTAKGNRVLRLVQKKTGNIVVIPIIDERLVSLLEKYDFNVPQVSVVGTNRHIKLICEELSETVPSLRELVPTQPTFVERELEKEGKVSFQRDSLGRVVKPKYQLVTSHTARRTCLTLMHLSRKYTVPQMMSVSGHKTEEIFFHYLKQSAFDDADSLVEAAGQDGLF